MRASVICLALFVALVQSAVQIGVYSDSDCLEMVGFFWYPGVYNAEVYVDKECTASSGGQYYDWQTGLEEFTEEDLDSTWNYLLLTDASRFPCVQVNLENAQFWGAIPNTCLNYEDNINGELVQYSVYIGLCENDQLGWSVSGGFDCPSFDDTASTTCETFSGGEITYTKAALCAANTPNAPVAAPSAAPTATTTPTSAPTGTPQTAAPASSTPTAAPARASSAAAMTPVAVGAVVLLAVLF